MASDEAMNGAVYRKLIFRGWDIMNDTIRDHDRARYAGVGNVG